MPFAIMLSDGIGGVACGAAAVALKSVAWWVSVGLSDQFVRA